MAAVDVKYSILVIGDSGSGRHIISNIGLVFYVYIYCLALFGQDIETENQPYYSIRLYSTGITNYYTRK